MTTELSLAIGDYPPIAPLKSGAVSSPLLKLNFAAVAPINRAFALMVRELKYDVSEMAIGTFIQAKAYGKRLTLLPVVTLARFQESAMLCRADSAIASPADLKGRRVGVRAYSQTTGLWLRGALADDYGVAPESIDWVTFEDAHVAEFMDRTKRAPAGKQIVQMLLDGELDAVLGEKVEHPDLKLLFADVKAEESRWFAKHGVKPINHMVVVKQELSDRHPDIVREVHRLLSLAGASEGPRFQAADMRRSLECITAYSAQQGLIARPFSADELFDDVTRPLIGKDH